MRTTMRHLSYGLADPSDLLEKLRKDAFKLNADPHPYNVFNFIITAAVLCEWIFKAHAGHPTVDEIATANEKRDPYLLPVICAQWVVDQTCIPNRHCDVRRHIMNALRICWETANASKHFHWTVSSSGYNCAVSRWLLGAYQFNIEIV